MDRLLDGAPRPSEPFFVDRVLGSTCVDRFLKPDDCKIGQLLGDAFKTSSDLVEFSGHDQHRIGRRIPSPA